VFLLLILSDSAALQSRLQSTGFGSQAYAQCFRHASVVRLNNKID